VRNASKMDTPGVAGYAGGGPHTDSSGVGGDEFVMQMLARNTDTTRYKRYLYLNLWRNISEDPIENDHLAVLDERTTAKPDDYIPRDLFGPGYSAVQYGLNARHAKHHKWYYFPQMAKSEGLLFKQVDSDFTIPARTCFHMSVKDPMAHEDAKPRESIELRMLCFWKEAVVDSMPTTENSYLHLKQRPDELPLEGSASLRVASFGQLGMAMVGKIFGFVPARAAVGNAYTGKPEDYLQVFTGTLQYFSYWPQAWKQWAEGLIKNEGEVKALATITKTIVDDSTGLHGTQHFTAEQKQHIVRALMADSAYMYEAKKQIVHLQPR
jgi:hypothetical protein